MYVTAPSNGLYIKSFPSGPCSLVEKEVPAVGGWTATPALKGCSGRLMSFSTELLLLSCLIGMSDGMAVYDGVDVGWLLRWS